MLNFFKIRCDYFIFRGNDRLDLIHRLSTNDVNSLKKNGVKKTILTSDKGRFIDLLTIYNFGDFVFASCSFNNSANVVNHLDKYTIMDDFKVENMTGTHESLLFYGDNPDEYIKDLTHIEPARIRDDEFLIYDSEGKHSIVHRNEDGFGGFIIIYASEDTEHFYNKLFDKRFTEIFGLRESNSNEYETKRIEYGIPKFGKEMNEHTNPLECGLEKYVSFTKGCYIGQEVISRLDTYDKVSKHLIGIKINEKLPSSGLSDIKITLDGKECGYSTSYADSEKYGSIGLGFVKTQFLDHNKDYKLKFNETLIECKITKLPFEN